MIRETGEVLGCPFLRVSVLIQVVFCDGKASTEGKSGYNPREKAKTRQPKKSDGCITALKFR